MKSINQFNPVNPVKPIAPYVGGKHLLAKRLITKINTVPHTLYAEPFVGMAGVFLKRDFAPKAEVINDYSKDVVNLFRILQRHFLAFMDQIRFSVTSRNEFNRLVQTNPETLTDLERAARFLYLQRTAFGGKPSGQNFGVTRSRGARFNLNSLETMLIDVHQRLAGVVIECLNYDAFIQRYDQAETLFYIDPPYWGCENYYGKDLFSKHDFEHLNAILKAIKGKFILSLNDVPEIRAIFSTFNIESVDTKYSIAAGIGYKKVKEVIITN